MSQKHPQQKFIPLWAPKRTRNGKCACNCQWHRPPTHARDRSISCSNTSPWNGPNFRIALLICIPLKVMNSMCFQSVSSSMFIFVVSGTWLIMAPSILIALVDPNKNCILVLQTQLSYVPSWIHQKCLKFEPKKKTKNRPDLFLKTEPKKTPQKLTTILLNHDAWKGMNKVIKSYQMVISISLDPKGFPNQQKEANKSIAVQIWSMLIAFQNHPVTFGSILFSGKLMLLRKLI